MRKILTFLLFAGLSINSFAQQKGDFRMRLRATAVVPQESATISTINGNVDISNTVIPELDFTYFLAKNFSANLILGTTKHEVSAINTALGNVDLGKVWLLPPTLTFAYHMPVSAQVQPYVGAGVNYTIFYGVKNAPAIAKTSYKNAFAPAAQLGVDFDISKKLFLNFDVKKLWLRTDATLTTIPNVAGGATVVADTKIDPWLCSLGIGIKL
ncbi:OmpW/AlkL family protein [Pedobacter sp. SL55]|uniref:OmpW/AlkL family protein n=1 Tax=Pedobacter sp. SL55 TaxID=2995161 RepID=UPI00226E957A|nr:OmpW family outer membrane protein [Pedobacter sp. SL55]WAC41647.1 outer membrane beta-barrel protein [Pedobacter sp. SL55]